MSRGQLILIEGLDRSGKSTQAELLCASLNSIHPTKLLKFPNRSTPIGQLINRYLTDSSFDLDDHSAHLLFSANRWEIQKQIVNSLNAGEFIIMDRYIYSGIAYSLSKTHTSPQLDSVDWLYSPDKGLPKPDLTLFLSISIEELSTRKGWGDERYELEEFQKKVKASFLKILKPEQDTTVEIVDVEGKSIEEVQRLLWGIAGSKQVVDVTTKPIQYYS